MGDRLSNDSERIWRTALKSGAKVLALNVIETAMGSADTRRKRAELNEMIAGHAEDRL